MRRFKLVPTIILWSKNKKKYAFPLLTPVLLYKIGVQGFFFNNLSVLEKMDQAYLKSCIALFYTTEELQTAPYSFKMDSFCGLPTGK